MVVGMVFKTYGAVFLWKSIEISHGIPWNLPDSLGPLVLLRVFVVHQIVWMKLELTQLTQLTPKFNGPELAQLAGHRTCVLCAAAEQKHAAFQGQLLMADQFLGFLDSANHFVSFFS